MPEPIVKQDGTTKNDCERHAAKRFIAKLRQDHPHLHIAPFGRTLKPPLSIRDLLVAPWIDTDLV